MKPIKANIEKIIFQIKMFFKVTVWEESVPAVSRFFFKCNR